MIPNERLIAFAASRRGVAVRTTQRTLDLPIVSALRLVAVLCCAVRDAAHTPHGRVVFAACGYAIAIPHGDEHAQIADLAILVATIYRQEDE